MKQLPIQGSLLHLGGLEQFAILLVLLSLMELGSPVQSMIHTFLEKAKLPPTHTLPFIP